MKLHHAAALALVGWYLLAPPQGDPRGTFREDAPLSEWEQWDSAYDSKAECEKALKEYQKDAQTDSAQCETFSCALTVAGRTRGRCIAADDPRLKEKQSGSQTTTP